MALVDKTYNNCNYVGLANNIYIIFHEIMTGVGRLGKFFAYEYLDIKPDFFVCIKRINL
ncbi:hypothetical protein M973_05230 [Francisella orientalis LADL 07-285A]|nr:hypothetical protein M973_05230 [Francisella orientalis LADL 07-285A]